MPLSPQSAHIPVDCNPFIRATVSFFSRHKHHRARKIRSDGATFHSPRESVATVTERRLMRIIRPSIRAPSRSNETRSPTENRNIACKSCAAWTIRSRSPTRRCRMCNSPIESLSNSDSMLTRKVVPSLVFMVIVSPRHRLSSTLLCCRPPFYTSSIGGRFPPHIRFAASRQLVCHSRSKHLHH